MTLEEFIKLLDDQIEKMERQKNAYVLMNQQNFKIGDTSLGFLNFDELPMTKKYKTLDSIYNVFVSVRKMIKESDFQDSFFPALEYIFKQLFLNKSQCLSVLVAIINQTIANINIESLENWMRKENDIVKKYPDIAKAKNYIFRTEEKIKEVAQNQFEGLKEIRKYLNEDGSLNPIAPSESLILDISFYLGIPNSLAELIIQECNRLFVINENAKEKANPQKIMKANITPNKNQKSISLEEKQKAYRKYIKYINPDDNYSVRYKEFIDDNLIKELENLINILDISNLNQQTIWKNIKNHNNEIINNQLNETFVETMSVLFPEVYKEIYNLTISLINNETLKQHHTYKYLVNEIADYQKGIETLIWQFINGDIDEEECKELIDINFLYLTEKLDELYQYQEINMILIREKKEE